MLSTTLGITLLSQIKNISPLFLEKKVLSQHWGLFIYFSWVYLALASHDRKPSLHQSFTWINNDICIMYIRENEFTF